MSSTVTHASFVALAYSFSQLSFFPLLLGLLIPDIDVVFNYLIQLFKGDLKSAVYNKKQGFMHTLIGLALFAVPVCITLTYLYDSSIPLSQIAMSSVLGVCLHILLDIPGHSRIGLFWPLDFDNPLFFKVRIPWLERFYPLSTKNMLAEYNWFVVSHVFVLPMLLLYIT